MLIWLTVDRGVNLVRQQRRKESAQLCAGGVKVQPPCSFGKLSVQKRSRPAAPFAIEVVKDAISTRKAWLLLGWMYEDDELPQEATKSGNLFLFVDRMSPHAEEEEHLRWRKHWCSTRW